VAEERPGAQLGRLEWISSPRCRRVQRPLPDGPLKNAEEDEWLEDRTHQTLTWPPHLRPFRRALQVWKLPGQPHPLPRGVNEADSVCRCSLPSGTAISSTSGSATCVTPPPVGFSRLPCPGWSGRFRTLPSGGQLFYPGRVVRDDGFDDAPHQAALPRGSHRQALLGDGQPQARFRLRGLRPAHPALVTAELHSRLVRRFGPPAHARDRR
jgi:hypothetical protein